MFDNIRFNENQKDIINKNLKALTDRGIHGTVQIDKIYLEREATGHMYQPKTSIIILYVVVSGDKYIEAIDIADTDDILFSNFPIEVIKDFYDECVQEEF